MNKYRHKTRGHPSIKQLFAFLLTLIVLVSTTPPIWQRQMQQNILIYGQINTIILITGSTVQYVERLRIKKHIRLQTIGLMVMKAVIGLIQVQEHVLADIHMFITSHIQNHTLQFHIHIMNVNTGCNVQNAATALTRLPVMMTTDH